MAKNQFRILSIICRTANRPAQQNSTENAAFTVIPLLVQYDVCDAACPELRGQLL